MRTGPKALVGLGLPAALRPHTPDKGGVLGPYAAPAGMAWAFVVESGSYVTENGQRVVALIRVS